MNKEQLTNLLLKQKEKGKELLSLVSTMHESRNDFGDSMVVFGGEDLYYVPEDELDSFLNKFSTNAIPVCRWYIFIVSCLYQKYRSEYPCDTLKTSPLCSLVVVNLKIEKIRSGLQDLRTKRKSYCPEVFLSSLSSLRHNTLKHRHLLW